MNNNNEEKFVLAKFRFTIDPPTKYGCMAERMWVKLYDNGRAVLDNEPEYLTHLRLGDEVDITNLELIEIYKD